MKTISILNLKGGVAKTFTAVNMAYELWRRGYKVLLLDNDKQGNLSKAYGRYDEESENQTERYKKLLNTQAPCCGFAAVNFVPIEQAYDYCIIDNPPDIGLNVVNALAITDEVIVPVKVDEDALEGLDIVADQIEEAKAFNERLHLRGVLVTVYQNTDGEAAGIEWLAQQGKYEILGIIKYSKKVAENSFMRKPIYEYSPCCGAAQSYKRFIDAYTGKVR